MNCSINGIKLECSFSPIFSSIFLSDLFWENNKFNSAILFQFYRMMADRQEVSRQKEEKNLSAEICKIELTIM